MMRKIIRIDKEKCNVYGVWADACYEDTMENYGIKGEYENE